MTITSNRIFEIFIENCFEKINAVNGIICKE